ncbi:MAG: hypothetical protein QM831_17290 [Kofleriaceae bacterium]
MTGLHTTTARSDGSVIPLVNLSEGNGYYPAFSDGESAKYLPAYGDTLEIVVTVSDGAHSLSRTGVVGTDRCGCHVEWKTTPDVIVWPY